jgi:hypothetical protein
VLVFATVTTGGEQGATSTSIFLWIAAGAVVALGMARLPLVPDRLWRFICWSGAVVLAIYAAARLYETPSGWIWATWAAGLIVVLAFAFWVETLLEHLEKRGTEDAKDQWRPASPAPEASPVQAPAPAPAATTSPASSASSNSTASSPIPIFDEAPPELADISPASLKELFAGRTDLQRTQLMEQHVGKEVRVLGTVEKVEGPRLRSAVIGQPDFHFSLFFDDENYDADPVLLVLNRGDEIAVSGRIFKIGETWGALDRCADIEVRGRAQEQS